METTMATDRADPSVNAWNAEYIEEMYRRWSADPESVDEHWKQFFLGFDLGARRPAEGGEARAVAVAHTKQGRVDSLIYHYRDIGHLAASLDPLGVGRPFPESLTLESFGLSEGDLDEEFDPGTLPLASPAPLSAIIELLRDTYCRHIGAEYMHIQDREQRTWLQRRMESVRNRPAPAQTRARGGPRELPRPPLQGQKVVQSQRVGIAHRDAR
jgi:2-oxoglutarate dehydrogenase E1 component